MIIKQANATGLSLNLYDLTELAAYDKDVTLGTSVFIETEQAWYQLQSNEDGIPLHGSAGASWNLLSTEASGTPIPTPDAVPQALDSGQLARGWLPSGQNPCTIYVAPYGDGDDDADGLTRQTMVNTASVGYAKLLAAGGGILNLSPNWRARADIDNPGDMAAFGLWIRGDGVAAENWQASCPCIITGEGVSPDILFCQPGAAIGRAGASTLTNAPVIDGGGFPYRKYPGIWIVKTTDRITIRDVALSDSVYCPARVSIDYNRDGISGAPQFLTCTSATRAAGEVTFSLTLPSAIPISLLNRAVNGTTVTASFGAIPNTPSGANATFPPWHVGTVVRIASTDANFPSGDVTITSVAANLDRSTDWSFTYEQANAYTGNSIANPATVQSHACSPGEFLDFASIIPQVPATQYRVSSVTADTVTVTDPYGGNALLLPTVPASGTWTNPGSLCHQERVYVAAMGVVFDNFSSQVPGDATFGLFYGGPTIDEGCSVAINTTVERCQLAGVFLADVGLDAYPRDEVRMAAWSVSPGNNTYSPATGAVALKNYSANGGLYQEAGGNGSSTIVVDWLGEASSGPKNAPAVQVYGNYNSAIKVDNARVADMANGLPEVVVDGLNPPVYPLAQLTKVDNSGIYNQVNTSYGIPVYNQLVIRNIGTDPGEISVGSANGKALVLLDSNQVLVGCFELNDGTLHG